MTPDEIAKLGDDLLRGARRFSRERLRKRELVDYRDGVYGDTADPNSFTDRISTDLVLRAWNKLEDTAELNDQNRVDQLVGAIDDITDKASLLRSLARLVSANSTETATKKRASVKAQQERLVMRVPGAGAGIRGNVADPGHVKTMVKGVKVKAAEEEIRSALEIHKQAEASAAASARELADSAGKLTPPEVDLLEKVLAGKEANVRAANANLQRALEKRAALLPADDDEPDATAQTELDEEEISGQFIQKIIK